MEKGHEGWYVECVELVWWIFRESVVSVWTVSIWLRIGTGGGYF